MGKSLDIDGLARLVDEIGLTVNEKNRISNKLQVAKILQAQVDQRLEDFLKIVQASDPSALTNTISEESVFFVCRALT